MYANKRPVDVTSSLRIAIPFQDNTSPECQYQPTSECLTEQVSQASGCQTDTSNPESVEQVTEMNPWGLPPNVWAEVPAMLRAYKYVDDILGPLLEDAPNLYKPDRYILLLKTPCTSEMKVLKITLHSSEIAVFNTLRVAKNDSPHLLYANMLHRGETHDFMLMPYYKTTLYDIMVNADTIDLRRALRYIDQLSQAIEIMNSNGLIHRDVKPENILVDVSSDRLMLFDFGHTVRSLPTLKHIPGGSKMFIPPEAYTTTKVTSGYDVWSLGVILYMAVYGGTYPFRIINDEKDYSMIVWPNISHSEQYSGVNSLITSMLNVIPEKRPMISNLRIEIWKQLNIHDIPKSVIESRKRARC